MLLIFVSIQSFGAGTHYRSAIFYADSDEKKQAQESKVKKQMRLDKRIVTKILPCASSSTFYLAESQHHKYYLQRNNVRLIQALGLRSSEQFADSHLACKLNGYVQVKNLLLHFDYVLSGTASRQN